MDDELKKECSKCGIPKGKNFFYDEKAQCIKCTRKKAKGRYVRTTNQVTKLMDGRPENCQKCENKTPSLIKFRGDWICRDCLNPEYEATYEPISASPLNQVGI